MKKKVPTYKRFFAYLIDLIIVALLSGILSIIITNNDKYDSDSRELIELTNKVAAGEVTKEEYYQAYDEINYNLTKDSVDVTIISCVVTVIYYSIMCYFCHGITLGKYLFKIKIIRADGQDISVLNYLLRSLIINTLLINIVTVILISVLDKATYISVYSKVSNAFLLLMIVSFIFMMYREDGRGLHDFIGNTKVVNINDLETTEKNEIVDANIVEEKEGK